MVAAILLIWIGTRLGAPAWYYILTGIMVMAGLYRAAKKEK